MTLQQLVGTIAGSRVEDWAVVFRPTFRHRFSPRTDAEGKVSRIDIEEARVHFTYRPDIRIVLGWGLDEINDYVVPVEGEIGHENARTSALDIYLNGRIVHRETMLRVDRQRCILPLPRTWSEPPQRVPKAQARVARLIHALAGPPTDFDAYFAMAGMVEVDAPWP